MRTLCVCVKRVVFAPASNRHGHGLRAESITANDGFGIGMRSSNVWLWWSFSKRFSRRLPSVVPRNADYYYYYYCCVYTSSDVEQSIMHARSYHHYLAIAIKV